MEEIRYEASRNKDETHTLAASALGKAAKAYVQELRAQQAAADDDRTSAAHAALVASGQLAVDGMGIYRYTPML
jgi:hypothetical protein